MHNSFGKIFKVHTFGESHGRALGAIIDGCPAGVNFDEAILLQALAKRRPGQSELTTPRAEQDQPEVLSGIFEGKTTGAPIAILIHNKDAKPKDYDHLKDLYRPGHADATYQQKYGLRDHRGGGRSSARTTVSMVIGGAIAQMYLKQISQIQVAAYVSSIHQLKMEGLALMEDIQKMDDTVRCPDPALAEQMKAEILKAKEEGNSLGGTITTLVQGAPLGLGEPQAHKLQAQLAHAMLSINAVKGFEYGLGFASTLLKGSEMNDTIKGQNTEGIQTQTNHSGGILGGISNGEDIYFRTAFKPTATIAQTQQTIDREGNAITLNAQGRHDPCVLPRAVAIVEAMTYLVLADARLMNMNAKV